MSKFIRHNALAILCTFALVFAAAAGVEAQTDDPIFDDEPVCSIQDNGIYWVAPVALQAELETHLNGVCIVEPMSSFVNRLPVATPINGVRVEGGTLSPSLAQDLEALGYNTESPLVPCELPGATVGVLRTL